MTGARAPGCGCDGPEVPLLCDGGWLPLCGVPAQPAAEVPGGARYAGRRSPGVSPPVRTGSADLGHHIADLEEMRLRHATSSFLNQRGAFEIRDPAADRALVEFCVAIPRDQFHRNGIIRSLARRMLAGRVPPAITQETRIVPGQPDWFAWADRRRDWIGAELERIEKSPRACDVLDVALMRRVFEDRPASAEEAAKPPRVHLLLHPSGTACAWDSSSPAWKSATTSTSGNITDRRCRQRSGFSLCRRSARRAGHCRDRARRGRAAARRGRWKIPPPPA